MRVGITILGLALVLTACGGTTGESTPFTSMTTTLPSTPMVPDGSLDPALAADLDLVFADLSAGTDYDALDRIGKAGDVRAAWLMSDLLRFFPNGPVTDAAVAAFEGMTGLEVTEPFPWVQVTDWLIAWDIPEPPGYVEWKRRPYEVIEPAWQPFFDDPDADIDWRLVSWGGVLIDDRPRDAVHLPCPEGCIPALDEPGLTGAEGGDWYDDDRIVFGVVVSGEARAYPKHIMEVHEMVNDEIGGRRIAIPYCTLCGSAQAWFTDLETRGIATLELRTSGLLSRSNKVMFDLETFSLFDTFLGVGLSGPHQGVELDQASVVTSTWGAWKLAHPNTTIVAQDGGIGRAYPPDPLQGRDDNGPIFPIGDVDPRLPVQEQVLGVLAPDGTPIAFPVAAAGRALDDEVAVELRDVVLIRDADGLRAETTDSEPLVSHQAFWFAWSQFHPDTGVWTPPLG
jgi:hypothetical protein